MNENKHGRRELPPANLKSQIRADWRRENVNRKPQFTVCSKCQTSILSSLFLIFDSKSFQWSYLTLLHPTRH